MSGMDTYESRHPLAQHALNELKAQADWDAADSGRMSGHSSIPDHSGLESMRDIELVKAYMNREADRRAYQDERR